MRSRNVIPKILAVSGTVFVCFPIFFTVLTSLIRTLSSGVVRFDYLMPAELFPLALAGALLLLLASLQTRSYRKSIIIGASAAVVFLVGGQAIAVLSGLASGATAPTGLIWAAVVTSIAVYSLAIVELGVVGILLARKLFSAHTKTD